MPDRSHFTVRTPGRPGLLSDGAILGRALTRRFATPKFFRNLEYRALDTTLLKPHRELLLLPLAARAIMTAASSDDNPLDGGSAHQARLAFAAVDPVL